jgi:biopolymer transport protein ExbD
MKIERRLKPSINIDLTPLIDVVFQLVIFFMITSVFKTVAGIPLDLPSSSSSENVAVQELRVLVVSESEIYVNRTGTDVRGLAGTLKAAKDSFSGQKTNVVVEGDSAIPYRLLVTVLDELRAQGLQEVGLATKPATD